MIKYDLDYNPILEYYGQIERGEVTVGEKIRRIYRKLVADLTDSKSEYKYSPSRANHVIEFGENFCRPSKSGSGEGPITLELWQKALLAAAFGFVHKISGLRKYTEVLLAVGRKNGKSTLSSIVGLYLMICDGEPGAEVYSVATKYDQAKIIWGESKKMVLKSPALLKSRKKPDGLIKPLVNEMVCEYNDSTFRPLASDSHTLDGLNVHGALFDELHEWKDKNLYDVVVDGCAAREQPMIFETTTMGTVREGVMDQLYDEAVRTVNGCFDGSATYKNERFLPFIYELDKRNEWTDPKCWAKANPGLGTIKKLDQLAAKVKKAQANPDHVKNLLCKDFNVPETSSEAWLAFEQINNTACFDLSNLKPRYGIGGADLSSTTDLTAAKVIFMVQNDQNIYVLSMYWIPEDLVEKRIAEDKIPYDKWIERGYVRTCPGNKMSYAEVTKWFLEVQNELDIYIPWVGYDEWSANYWAEEMSREFGKNVMQVVRQGAKTFSGPMKQLGADLSAKRVVYNNSPVDKWCLANTSVKVDTNGNITPVKSSSPRKRIDGTAALLDAYVVLLDKMTEYMSMI
jgi:phage terminase large subunit-like protein